MGIKQDFSWLKGVNSQSLQMALRLIPKLGPSEKKY